jgi:hypothetical protein
MTRSPLAYPLNRSADLDAGGAADLQTDIMRFMAILSLCLVAIFALVQSIPLTPIESVRVEDTPVVPTPEPIIMAVPEPEPAAQPQPAVQPQPDAPPVEKTVVLTRPKWQPKYLPAEKPVASADPVIDAPSPPPPTESREEGFTLRFASDAALMRAVASQQVGLYAIESGRAQRMTVSESRVSFWDASTPNTFHEMKTSTVPTAVIDALSRTGSTAGEVSWGVTLPGKMTLQLDQLMQAHRGGSLIIDAGGEIHWEAK